MEFVFFNCKELDQQTERVKRLLSKGEDVFDNSDVFWGIGKDCKKYRLEPSNIKNDTGRSDNYCFSLIDANKPLVSKTWKNIKKRNKIKRDTPQSEAIFKDLGIMPFKAIYKDSRPYGKKIWGDFYAKDTQKCDYFALMIDPSKNALVGVAKAEINRPGSNIYEIPLGSDILPDTVEYIYISSVDIYPSYIGNGYCRPLVTFLMNKISELLPTHIYFHIDNASINDEGIPACVCYVKSGTENGYDVYYSKYKSNIVNKMTPELCYISDEQTRYEMPDTYYYVKKATGGGMKAGGNKPGLVQNPNTGRWIKEDGALAKKLGLRSN